MKKNLMLVVLSLVLVFSMSMTAFAHCPYEENVVAGIENHGTIDLIIDGVYYSVEDDAVIMVNDNTFIPVNTLFDEIGPVFANTTDVVRFVLPVSTTEFFSNPAIKLDESVYKDRPIIPLTVYTDVLVCSLQWNSDCTAVYINLNVEDNFMFYNSVGEVKY